MTEVASEEQGAKKNVREVGRSLSGLIRFKDRYGWPIAMLIGGLRPLHYWAVGRLADIKKGEKVLEVGSGYPLWRIYSQRVGKDGAFVAVDIDEKIQAASRRICYWFGKIFSSQKEKPKEKLVTEVVAVTKKNLKAGETLDGGGGYTVHGVIERADIAKEENLLPLGFAYDIPLVRDVPKDMPVTYADVKVDTGGLLYKLRQIQDAA